MKIEGGATVWARQTLESDIFFNKPPEWFKVWFYIVNNVRHKPNKQFRRGEGYFCWSMDRDELCGVSAHQWHECIKWLKKAKQITTRKTTRGNVILVLNYELYQKLNNYKTEAQTEVQTEARPKHVRSTTDTINKNVRMEECNNANAQNFDLFWKAYPKRRSKQSAFKAFMRVKVPFDVLLSAIEKQKQSEDWLKEHGKFIPYPATWLNAGSWEDEATDDETNRKEGESFTDWQKRLYFLKQQNA